MVINLSTPQTSIEFSVSVKACSIPCEIKLEMRSILGSAYFFLGSILAFSAMNAVYLFIEQIFIK